MPGNDGLWLDDDDGRAPPVSDTRQLDPEQAVRSSEPEPLRPRLIQHLQLVPQREYLKVQSGA
jgi:hypothetical protein